MNKINFTYKIKKEIYLNVIENEYLNYVVAGILYNSFSENDSIERDFNYITSNFDVIKILKKFFNNSEIIKEKTRCEILFKLNSEIIRTIEEIWQKRNNNLEAIKLFFCGFFLSCGSVSDPSKSYHLELRVISDKAEDIKWVFKKIGVNFLETIHQNKTVFYIKKNEYISDVLKLLKAHECMFYFEECKISKDFNISIQRINNLDISNINKQIKGSQEIISIIEFLSNTTTFNKLDPLIIQYCEERKRYPEYSIKQIVEILNKKVESKNITKSWVNHVNIKLRKMFAKYK